MGVLLDTNEMSASTSLRSSTRPNLSGSVRAPLSGGAPLRLKLARPELIPPSGLPRILVNARGDDIVKLAPDVV